MALKLAASVGSAQFSAEGESGAEVGEVFRDWIKAIQDPVTAATIAHLAEDTQKINAAADAIGTAADTLSTT